MATSTKPNFETDKRTILRVQVGSQAYGTATADSDVDMRSVVIPPLSDYLSFRPFEIWAKSDPDHTMFSLRLFLERLAKGNFSAVEMLWVEEKNIEYLSDEGKALRDMRRNFTTKGLVQNMVGYAVGTMTEGYFAKRTGKRAELTKKYGYDTKSAMHSLRIIKMADEVLAEGTVNVYRCDAKDLLEIRAGAVPKDEIAQFDKKILVGGLLFKTWKNIENALKTSTLPDTFNYVEAESLAIGFAQNFTVS